MQLFFFFFLFLCQRMRVYGDYLGYVSEGKRGVKGGRGFLGIDINWE